MTHLIKISSNLWINTSKIVSCHIVSKNATPRYILNISTVDKHNQFSIDDIEKDEVQRIIDRINRKYD